MFKPAGWISSESQQTYLQLTAILPGKKNTAGNLRAVLWNLMLISSCLKIGHTCMEEPCVWVASVHSMSQVTEEHTCRRSNSQTWGGYGLCWVVGWWMVDGGWMDASWLGGWMDANVLFPNHRGPLLKLRPFSELRNLIVQHRSSQLQLHTQMRPLEFLTSLEGGHLWIFWCRWI